MSIFIVKGELDKAILFHPFSFVLLRMPLVEISQNLLSKANWTLLKALDLLMFLHTLYMQMTS